MGAGAPLPVERCDVLPRRSARAPGGVAVGAGARLSVGSELVCPNSRQTRARGGGAVGEGSTCALTGTHPRPDLMQAEHPE